MSRLLWAALAALLTLAAPATAQAADPDADVAAGTPGLRLDPGEEGTAEWTVTNAGPLQATATVTLDVPDGWQATLGQADRSFSLAAGASRTLRVPVSPATAGDGAGPASGELALSATMTDGAGRTSAPASASVPLTFVPAPPPPPPADNTVAIVAGVASAVALLALAAGLWVYLRRAVRVALYVEPQQRPITAGTDGIFLVQVENRGRRAREVELRVDGLPGSWYGAFSFPTVRLNPGERSPVPLCIKVPAAAGDGMQAELVLRARPSRMFPWLVQARTRVEAHDRVRIGPAVQA